DEVPKKDADRLPEYRSTALESLKLQLFSPAPISREYEQMKLTGSLYFMVEELGNADSLKVAVPDRAQELVSKTKLTDVAERKRLFDGGVKEIEKSDDPMIEFARMVDKSHPANHMGPGLKERFGARALRQRFDELEEIQAQAYAEIAKIRFKK